MTGPSSNDLSPSHTATNAHYGRSDFGDAILTWLRAQGTNLDELTAEDLTAVDQFHGGGVNATRELAELAGPSAETRVVDLGGGIGGPARFLAATHGCTVEVVDITAEFCRLGQMLTELTRLDQLVTFHQASATDTGLPEASFDLAWVQNSAMNIEDRTGLYREIRRLLRPGGRFVLQEVFAGDAGPPAYPLPWASAATDSFLQAPEAVLGLLISNGFRVLVWEDTTLPAGAVPRPPPTTVPSFLDPAMRELVSANVAKATLGGNLRTGKALLQRL